MKDFRDQTGSTDDLHLAGVADDNVLAAAFDQMESASPDFLHEHIGPNLAIDIAPGPPDDATTIHSVCGKDLIGPSEGSGVGMG